MVSLYRHLQYECVTRLAKFGAFGLIEVLRDSLIVFDNLKKAADMRYALPLVKIDHYADTLELVSDVGSCSL